MNEQLQIQTNVETAQPRIDVEGSLAVCAALASMMQTMKVRCGGDLGLSVRHEGAND